MNENDKSRENNPYKDYLPENRFKEESGGISFKFSKYMLSFLSFHYCCFSFRIFLV